MRNSLTLCGALLLATLGAAGCESDAADQAPTPAPKPEPAATEPVAGVIESSVVTAEATVTAIDHGSRRVTIRRDDGTTVAFRADDSVRNLAQVKAGDRIQVQYQESLAYEVRKPGESEPGAMVAAGGARAKEGEKPGGVVGGVVQVTATIAAIDRETMRVTLRAPDGSFTVVKARDPEKLARVVVGDLVEITYTEALAVSVTTPAAK